LAVIFPQRHHEVRPRVSLVDRIIGARKTWLAPLIIAILIFAILFFLVGGKIDIPFLYRSAK
jgi:Family of unknown function (DUF5989)